MGLWPTGVSDNQRRNGRRHAKDRHVCATQAARCDFQEPLATKDPRSSPDIGTAGILHCAQNDSVEGLSCSAARCMPA